MDVMPQNNPNTVFYIITDHKCEVNFLELLRYFSYFQVYKRETQHKYYVSSKLFTCNCVTNEITLYVRIFTSEFERLFSHKLIINIVKNEMKLNIFHCCFQY